MVVWLRAHLLDSEILLEATDMGWDGRAKFYDLENVIAPQRRISLPPPTSSFQITQSFALRQVVESEPQGRGEA